MREFNSGIICNIILKAREISIEDDLVPPDNQNSLSDTEWKQALSEYQEDLTYLELKDLINELEPDQQLNIIALMYIGRGDYNQDEWSAAIEQALSIPSATRADYLISKGMLADYLEEGLSIFGYSCNE